MDVGANQAGAKQSLASNGVPKRELGNEGKD